MSAIRTIAEVRSLIDSPSVETGVRSLGLLWCPADEVAAAPTQSFSINAVSDFLLLNSLERYLPFVE
jgi:hypothetical protein